MMKTIRDAVIELKGKWDFSYDYLCSRDPSSNGYLFTINDANAITGEDGEYLICSREEFNTYVNHLASNRGRAAQSYAEYKKEFDCMTSPTIDWSKAPHWADRCVRARSKRLVWVGKGDQHEYVENGTRDIYLPEGVRNGTVIATRPLGQPTSNANLISPGNQTTGAPMPMDENSDQYKTGGDAIELSRPQSDIVALFDGKPDWVNGFSNLERCQFEIIATRPVKQIEAVVDPTPIYTREMREAGEFPQVGSHCEVFKDDYYAWHRSKVYGRKGHRVIADHSEISGQVELFDMDKIRAIDARTDKEKACDAVWKELDKLGGEYDLRVAMELAYDRWVGK